MSGHSKRLVGKSVGIKELKDRASEIIATVERTGRAVSIVSVIAMFHQSVVARRVQKRRIAARLAALRLDSLAQ